MNIIQTIFETLAQAFNVAFANSFIETCSSTSCTCCNEEEHTPNTPNIAPKGLVWLV